MHTTEIQKELLDIENKFAAITVAAKHARRLRELQNMDKAEYASLADLAQEKIEVVNDTLPVFLREPEEEGAAPEAKHRKKKKRK